MHSMKLNYAIRSTVSLSAVQAIAILLAAVTMFSIIACSNEPPERSSLSIPVETGQPATTVIYWITPDIGDTVELLSAEAIGLSEVSDVRFLLSRPIDKPNGGTVWGESYESLSGALITGELDTRGIERSFGIGAEIRPNQAGRFVLDDIRLRYRVNGGRTKVHSGVDVEFVVCADSPIPETCDSDL